MIKSILFTIFATLESIFAIIVIWKHNPFLLFLGVAFAFMLWIQFRIMRLNSRLNVMLMFSMIAPIIWLFSKTISLFIQSPVMDKLQDPVIMLICPCLYIASMMDIFIRRIDEKVPYVITWPFDKEKN